MWKILLWIRIPLAPPSTSRVGDCVSSPRATARKCGVFREHRTLRRATPDLAHESHRVSGAGKARSAQLPVRVLIRPWLFSSARPAVTALLVAKKKGHSRGLSRLPWQARSTAVRSTYRRHHHNSIPLRNTSACRLLDSARCNKTRPRLRLDWPMQSARFPMRLIRTRRHLRKASAQ